MPGKANNLESEQVLIPHECHIPVSRHRFLQVLEEAILDQKQQAAWKDFAKLIEAVYHFRFHQIATELKEDFLLFDTRQGGDELLRLTPAEVHQREMRFLRNFTQVMKRGNFRALTAIDIEVAAAEDYLFTLPVTVDWERLDDDLLSRYWDLYPPEAGQEPPDFAKRILVFQRGIGVEQSYALHLLAKVDILMNEMFEIILWLPRWLAGKPVSHRKEKRKLLAESREEACSEERSHRFDDRFIQRVPLRLTRRGWSWLCRKTLIQEPTFQELVILYRPATPEPDTESDPVPLKNHSIQIKAFNDIPMADLEVVFPEKKISMKPLDLIKLSATGIVGFVMVLTKLVVQAAINPVLALAALATMAGYASKVLMGFKVSRDRYQHVVTTSLYDKNRDNNLGVVFFLMDSLEEQELKETLLAYFVLWRDGTLKQSELDDRCEEFLLKHYGVEVDFEVGDALDKLAHEGLVTSSGTHYTAIPLERALFKLDEQWDNYFRFNDVSDVSKTA